MKLPKRELPTFELTLPVSSKIVSYRPYTVKEEKIIEMAQVGEDLNDKYNAICQIVENCCNVDPKKLHPADLQFLFLKIYSTSESPIVNVSFNVAAEYCGSTEDNKYEACPKTISTSFNIDKDVSVVNLDAMNKHSKKAKGEGRIINLIDNISLQIEYRSIETKENVHIDLSTIVYDMLISIILPDEDSDDPEELTYIAKEDISFEEFSEFLDSFQPKDLSGLKEFFIDTPKCQTIIKTKCPKCKKEFKSEQTGLISFLI